MRTCSSHLHIATFEPKASLLAENSFDDFPQGHPAICNVLLPRRGSCRKAFIKPFRIANNFSLRDKFNTNLSPIPLRSKNSGSYRSKQVLPVRHKFDGRRCNTKVNLIEGNAIEGLRQGKLTEAIGMLGSKM